MRVRRGGRCVSTHRVWVPRPALSTWPSRSAKYREVPEDRRPARGLERRIEHRNEAESHAWSVNLSGAPSKGALPHRSCSSHGGAPTPSRQWWNWTSRPANVEPVKTTGPESRSAVRVPAVQTRSVLSTEPQRDGRMLDVVGANVSRSAEGRIDDARVDAHAAAGFRHHRRWSRALVERIDRVRDRGRARYLRDPRPQLPAGPTVIHVGRQHGGAGSMEHHEPPGATAALDARAGRARVRGCSDPRLGGRDAERRRERSLVRGER